MNSSSTFSSGRRRLLQALGLGGLSLGQPLLLSGCLGGGGDDEDSPSSVWPEVTAARDYLAASGLVLPVALTRSRGAVSGAASLASGGSCTLTAGADASATQVVLDYGRVVGGVPQFEVLAFSGSPVVTLACSESLAHVDGGDTTLGFSIASEPARAIAYPVTATGVVRGRLLQGGQRYQTLSVSGSGSVTLRQVVIDAVLIEPVDTPADTGWFQCSSPVLNRIWSAGAYTVDLNRMAAGTQPSPWSLGADGATIGASNVACYQGGASWLQYQCAFDLTVNQGGASWLVRGSALTRLSFTLSSADDGTRPDTLWVRTGSIFIGGVRELATVTLPQALVPGVRHRVVTEVGDSQVSVALDGVVIATVALADVGFLPPGSVGFWNEPGHTALIARLDISDPSGQSLHASTLGAEVAAEVYRSFPVGPNPVAVLTDGAKRERQLFSLDLVAAAPPLYYSSGATACVANSLLMLSRYRTADGQWAGTLDPSVPFEPTHADSAPQMRWYSLSYSLYNLIALADYLRHTGDTALVTQLWPAVLAELDWLQGRTDASGLIVTDASNGLDWHPQFGGMATGVVAQFNVAWTRALADAAMLAEVMGDDSRAQALATQSRSVQAALQATLFNGDTGVFDLSDTQRGSVAQDANALAVLWGVASAEQVPALLSRLATALATPFGHRAFSSDTGWTGVISPLVSGFEVAALFEAGQATQAVALIEAGWSMMVGDGVHACGTTWESMTLEGVPAGPDISLAHGWSAGPTASLSRHVLGVRPVTPGYARWLAKPLPSGLDWAAGQVPTPHGPILLRWALQPTAALAWTLEVTVPAGTVATVALPLSVGSGRVRLDGATVTPSTRSADDSGLDAADWRYLGDLGPGRHVVDIDRT